MTDSPDNEILNKKEQDFTETTPTPKKPLSHAKLSSLSKARAEKALKIQQQNFKDEMQMSTLNNIYEKLNLIDSKIFSFGGMKRTMDNLETEKPKSKKAKTEIIKEEAPYGIIKYIPIVGLFVFGSVVTRYATNKLREYLLDGDRQTTDRDNIPWSRF